MLSVPHVPRVPGLPRRAARLGGTAALALLVALGGACEGGTGAGRGSDGARPAAAGAPLVDDFGDTIDVERPPRRIVSLNPSTTEILFALGAGPRLVGRTRWDAYPDSARLVPDLGDGIRPNVEAVLGAHPDLVVLYASADNRDAAYTLRQAGVRTVSLRLDRIAQFREAVTILGRVLGDTARARTVVDTVDGTLARVRRATAPRPHPTVFWKAWDAPLLAIGGGSFMTELLEIAGARNVYGHIPSPSPQVTLEDVVRRDPDIVLAGANSSRTFRTNPAWRALRAVREGRILVVDTTLMAFPSVRLGEAAASLAELLHPGALR